ncbi:MAG: cytochrome c-type biogenesis protein CcmH [Caldilineae bacterium]|nr:MAG: cytochrome c-type biogenesis protein CcmH [Caldilineae bacterium]
MRRFLLALFLLLLVAVPAAAQENDPAKELQKELWCPICQGIRLDVCEQKVCEQMREMIDQRLAEGYTKEQVKAEFIELYGPVVLGEPPRQGFTLLAWVIPVLLVIGGLAAAVVLTRRWTRQTVSVAAPSTADVIPEDEYLKRVEEELNE